MRGGGRDTHFIRSRSRMAIDPRILKMSGRRRAWGGGGWNAQALTREDALVGIVDETATECPDHVLCKNFAHEVVFAV